MNNPFLRYRYGGVVSPQQSSGLGSLFPVQRLKGGGSVGGRYSQGLPLQRFYSGGSAQSGGREGSESPSGRGFGGGGGGGVGSDPLGRAEHISRIGASIAANRSPSPSPNPLTRQAIQTRNRQALARARAKEREAFAPINDKKKADSIIEGLMSNLANKTMAEFDEAARVSKLANATVQAAQEKAALARAAVAPTTSLLNAPTQAVAPKSMYSDLVTNMLSAPTVDPTQPANLGLVAPTVDPTQAYDARAAFAPTTSLLNARTQADARAAAAPTTSLLQAKAANVLNPAHHVSVRLTADAIARAKATHKAQLANATVKAAQEKDALARSALAPTTSLLNARTQAEARAAEKEAALATAPGFANLAPVDATQLEGALKNRALTLSFYDKVRKETPASIPTFARVIASLIPGLNVASTIAGITFDARRNAALDKAAAEAGIGQYAQSYVNDKKTGLGGILARLGFRPSTDEGKGGLGEGTISSGPGPQVDLLPKPPGGGLATLPQSPSNVPPSANNLQQVPIPGAPGFSVTIGNPLVPTIFPLS